MTWETASEEVALACRFVQRLAQLPPALLRPAVPPVLNRDPYLSAWTNVEAALGNAPPPERERLRAAAAELDEQLRGLALPAELAEAARRALRGLLVRRRLGTGESFKFVYEPFESVVPVDSLGA